jgi:pyruvate kinase
LTQENSPVQLKNVEEDKINVPVANDEPSLSLDKKISVLYAEVIVKSERARERFPIKKKDSEASRDNLLAYLALREKDLSSLQLALANEGLSSLGRLEGNVLINIERVMAHLRLPPKETMLSKPTSQFAYSTLEARSRALLGRPRDGRRTRIMVTLDPATMYQPELLEQLLISGMDIARINCAHDTPTEWLMLINAIRTAEDRLIQRGKGIGRTCRILMDLAGPKIRTGGLSLESRPLKLAVPKDPFGNPSRMLEGTLDCEAGQSEKLSLTGMMQSFTISLKNQSSLSFLNLGERLRFADSRGRTRYFVVLEKLTPTKVRVGLSRTAFIEEGIQIKSESGHILAAGPVKPQPAEIMVKVKDTVRLYRDPKRLGKPASKEEPASISCTLPEAMKNVKVGDTIFIDDGKIGAKVRAANSDFLEIEITSPTDSVAVIKPEKGINFPESEIGLPALTEEDIQNLEFIVQHATAVGLSFVQKFQDILDLEKALSKLGHEDFGIVAKIETKEAIHNLAEIILTGLDVPKFGVLIARGDLAVEVGFENLAFVQEDILCMCEAAHLPVVFATQVLETLAKSGLPSRAEITDAAMGIRAECVMLNKGPHVLEATKTLSGLLSVEEKHQMKKRQIFREFTKQQGIF